MPLFKRTSSESLFRPFKLKHDASRLLVDMQRYTDPDAFLHVDCDQYSSTVTFFDELGERLQPGAIVLFDEFDDFHCWQRHEFRAVQEFAQKSGVNCEHIAFSVAGQQVAVRILDNPACSG